MRPSEEYGIINRYTGATPVDVKGIIRALGILYHEAYLSDNISGMLERIGVNRFRITVNATDAKTRKRFTAAHELGHYMHHRHLIGDGIDDNKAYRSTSEGKYHNTNIGPLQETEANKFAANLLMPERLVRNEYFVQNDLNELASEFEVSKKALEWRLVNLKIATKEQLGL